MLDLSVIRSVVETDLSDSALQMVAQAEYAELISRYGDDEERVEIKTGGNVYLVMTLPAASIASIKERAYWINQDVTETTLSVDDYVIMNGGRKLMRVGSGTNPAWSWAGIVELTYTPPSREYQRNRVLCDLIKLTIQHNGTSEEWFGDYKAKFPNSYHTARERIMRQMAPNRGMVLA